MVDNIDKIIKGCVKNKRDAQAKLYKLYSKKMFGVCLLYTKDRTAAEDVVQDGFIKVFKNISQYSGKGSFEGWLRRVMVNCALERYRREHYLYPVSEVNESSNDFSYDNVLDEISAKDLMSIIHKLSPQYRTVFSLFAIEGYSHKEISKQLKISEGASKSNLSRARKILQQKVELLYNVNAKKLG